MSQVLSETLLRPYIEIVEQPCSKSSRFRYESEGSTGFLPGKSCTPGKKTYPAIKIHNYTGKCVVVVSLVTLDEPAKPHPHALVGEDCKEDICSKRIENSEHVVQFPKLCIRYRKKNEIAKCLEHRQEKRIDPFKTGFAHKEESTLKEIDLTVVRLCFQVFLPDKKGNYTKGLKPVCSEPIYDKKSVEELRIFSFLPPSCTVKGGESMILLTGKLPKDDFEVRFYEESTTNLEWEAFGSFDKTAVHQNVAVTIKIPPYTNASNMHQKMQKKEVKIVLRRKSRPEECSEPVTFLYLPEGQSNMGRPRKRAPTELEKADQKKPRLESEVLDSKGEQFYLPESVSKFDSASSEGSLMMSGNSSALMSIETASSDIPVDDRANNVNNRTQMTCTPSLMAVCEHPIVSCGSYGGSANENYTPVDLNHPVTADTCYGHSQAQNEYSSSIGLDNPPITIHPSNAGSIIADNRPGNLNQSDLQIDSYGISEHEVNEWIQQNVTDSYTIPDNISGVFNSSGSLVQDSVNDAAENQSTSLTKKLRSITEMDTQGFAAS